MSVTTSRWRLVVGIASLLAAAIVGLVGYLKLSLESQLNHQLPYLASAGMAVIVLSAIGVAFIVVDQIRTDEVAVQELATAVERLADALASDVERPARTD